MFWQQTQSCEPHVSTVFYCSSLLRTSSTFCRGSGTATTLSEVSLNLTSGTLTMTDYTSFLNSSVLVTGAVLASNGDCVIGDTIAFNISTQENDNEGEGLDTQSVFYHPFPPPFVANFTEIMGKLFDHSNVMNILVSQLLQLPTPSTSTVLQPLSTSTVLQPLSTSTVLEPTDIPSSDETDSLSSSTVALIAVVVFLSSLILLIVCILFLCRKLR